MNPSAEINVMPRLYFFFYRQFTFVEENGEKEWIISLWLGFLDRKSSTGGKAVIVFLESYHGD